MMKRVYFGIKYLLIMAVLSSMSVQAYAGGMAIMDLIKPDGFREEVTNTDFASERLVNYYDDRELRDSYVQVTNVSEFPIQVNVQIFDVGGDVVCDQCSFTDFYTPGDTHVYNMANIVRNIDQDILGDDETRCEGVAGGFGAVFVSFSAICNADFTDCGRRVLAYNEGSGPLIGMFRVLDSTSNMEYRTNSANPEGFYAKGPFKISSDWDTLNFHSNFGFNLSDVVGITYQSTAFNDSVDMRPDLGTLFGSNAGDPFQTPSEVHIFDNAEVAEDCAPVIFACDPVTLNQGLSLSHPNSLGNTERLCDSDVDEGWVYMPFNTFVCAEPLGDGNLNCPFGKDELHFTGFLGLNNADGKGSMDSWWQTHRFEKRKKRDRRVSCENGDCLEVILQGGF